jgi:peptidoglycan/LPS O-acetylase OafA/YrhL
VKNGFHPVKRGFSANLDLLRSIAVLLVLAQHLCRRLNVDHASWMATSSWGTFGVLLFFVHTSLVLMYSLERSQLTGLPLLKNFYMRRIFRIYPVSILVVCAALALHLDSDINGIRGLSHGPFPGVVVAASNLLLVQNLTYAKSIVNVLWSLPFELQMYAFLPFIFMWARGRPRFWLLLGIWAVCAVVGAAQPHVPRLGRLSIFLFVPNFLPGIIAFSRPHVPRISCWLWPLFIIALVAVFAAHPGTAMGWALCLLLGILIPSFGEIPTPWLRCVSNRLATYSYGIYLSHQFCIWIAFGVLASYSQWFRLTVLIMSLVALPILLYHTIEKPMIQAAVRLANKPLDPRAIVHAAAAP